MDDYLKNNQPPSDSDASDNSHNDASAVTNNTDIDTSSGATNDINEPSSVTESKENSSTPRILLAEDEEDARIIYLDILQSGGFNADGAINGATTLNYLSKNVYDLLLLDIIMPDMDGISVLAEIKKYPAKYGTPKIVMLTNIGGDLAIEKALNIGANGYMLKSETEPDQLIDIIRKYLAGQDHIKSSLKLD